QDGGGSGRWTTVTQWWTGSWTVLNGEVFDGNKRAGFLEVVDLPRRVPAGLRLPGNIHPGGTEDLARPRGPRRALARPADAAATAGTSPSRRTSRARPRRSSTTYSPRAESSAAPSPRT